MGKHSGLKHAIRDHDMFGHVINLNFNRQGPTHNTVIGGLFSILIKVAMSVYVFLNFKKLLFKEDDSIGLRYYNINLNELDPVDYSTSDFIAFWVLSKSRNGYQPIFLNSIDPDYNRNISTMIKIEYLQQNSNWYNAVPHDY